MLNPVNDGVVYGGMGSCLFPVSGCIMRYIPPRIDAEEGARFSKYAKFFQHGGALTAKKRAGGLKADRLPLLVPIKLGFETA